MTTYYVRPTNGSDGNAGTSFGAAFATTQKALDTATAGDVIRLCPEAAESVSVQIDDDTNTGSIGSMVRIETGNTTDGAQDLTIYYTLQATASIACILKISTLDYKHWSNVIFVGNSNATDCVNQTSYGADNTVFVDCEFKDATGDGVDTRGNMYFYNCLCHDNGGLGYNRNGGNRGAKFIYGGRCYDNGSDGIMLDRIASQVINCEIYGNGGHGIEASTGFDNGVLIGNTIYNNTLNGISLSSGGYNTTIYNNTLVDNGGYGVDFNGLTVNQTWYCDYNHTHSNTSGASDITLPGSNNQTGDPQFTNTTAGSEDFTPTSGSPLIDNGAFS